MFEYPRFPVKYGDILSNNIQVISDIETNFGRQTCEASHFEARDDQ